MTKFSRLIFTSIVLFGNLSAGSSLALTNALVDFSLAAAAGSAGAFVSYPIDYVKCQMQTESGKAKYKNGLDCFVRTVSDEGPLQLFRGVGVQVAGVTPEQSIKLSVNDFVKRIILTQMGVLHMWGQILAASAAGICQVVVTAPLETLKVSFQTTDKTLKELMKDIGGVRGLFRAAEACILRDIIFSVALFPIYLILLKFLPPFVAGGLAGVVAAFVATPPDFIKTRIMTENRGALDSISTSTSLSDNPKPPFVLQYTSKRRGGALLSNNGGASTNPFVVGRRIAKKEGWRVMFTGVFERCLGSIPRFGVTLSLYDLLKRLAIAHGWMV